MENLKLGLLASVCMTGACFITAACTDTPKTDAPETKATETFTRPAANPTKNAYFGDLHVHTANSFDAYIFGTRTDADAAYRFAKGETIDNGAKHAIKLDGPPLDFYGVTDHGEYLGVVRSMATPGSKLSKTETGQSIFGLGGGSRDARRQSFINIGTTVVTGDAIEEIYDTNFMDSVWAQNVAAAEKHYIPGKFTTFAGYEFTSMLLLGEDGRPVEVDDANLAFGPANLHRNVIFKNTAPKSLFTTLNSPNPEDLWSWMNGQRAAGIDSLSIPHNSNASNGLMFSNVMYEGGAFGGNYAANRMLNEPIAEIAQIKGTSETHPALSRNDEWADFEIYDNLIGSNIDSIPLTGSFVRQTWARGIGLEDSLGGNPYKFGVIGASDTHVSAPSVSEENHFGKFPHDMEAENRQSTPPKGADEWPERTEAIEDLIATPQYGASGLAGVWAEENTRESIFGAMRRKETFGTSGPRMKVRFFASQNFGSDILGRADMLTTAYAVATPMGGTVMAGEASPTFLTWAIQDPNGTPLQRVQIIKVWHEGGAPQETIYDVSCSDGSAPNAATHRCVDNGASVDVTTCKTRSGTGASEMKTLWSDPDFEPSVSAAYYVRVLENPSCRWSTWDAVRNGTPPNPDMAAVIQERAWSSPIWVKPAQ